MGIDMTELRQFVDSFIDYNGLADYIFFPNNNDDPIYLNDENTMMQFKHWCIGTAISIMVEWYYDCDIDTDLNDEDSCKRLRCHLLDKLQCFPYDVGHWREM